MQGIEVGGFVAPADAALDGPVVGGVPYQIGPRADVAAERLMIFVSGPQGQRQVIPQTPFILGEQCPALLREGINGNAVFQLGIPVLRTQGGDMVFTNRSDQLGIEDDVGGLELAIITYHDRRIAGVAGARVGAGNGATEGLGTIVGQGTAPLADAQASIMPQHCLIAQEPQLISVAVDPRGVEGGAAAGGAAALAPIQITQLAVIVVVGLNAPLEVHEEVVHITRGQVQSDACSEVLAFDRRGTALADIAAIIEGDIRCIALIEAAAQSYAGKILDQRAAGVEVGAGALAVVAVFLENVVHGRSEEHTSELQSRPHL